MLAALISIVAAQSQISGVYKPATGDTVAWQINEHHALIWQNEPYIPVGLHVEGSRDSLEAAVAAGAKDLIVDLPVSGAGWAEAVQFLESKKIRYLISINSAAKPAKGVVIQPETYRLSGITTDGDISFPVNGAPSAYAVAVTQRNGNVMKQGRFKAEDGKIKFPLESGGLEHVLLVYPETTSMAQPDYWDDFDNQRDDLLAALRATKFGPGLRGILDPVGQAVSLFGRPKSFVPTSNAFRMELKAHLVEKYRNFETATRAWAIGTNDFSSLDDLSHLVPLFSENRGLDMMWNPEKDYAYKFTPKSSTVWADIDEVIRQAAVKRYDRLVTAIRQVVDVPVIQRWSGSRGPYESANPSLSGIGISVSGASSSQIAESAAPAASTVFRWNRRGWLIASAIESPSIADAAAELGAMGVRGFFARPTPDILKEIGAQVPDNALAQWSPTPLFYPEAASNPAAPMRLPSGYYWLPSPIAGNRLEFGPLFNGYRYEINGTATTVLWTGGGRGRVRLRAADPKALVFQPLDGSNPEPKLQKFGVEVTMSEIPMVITGSVDAPIPEPAYVQTTVRFDKLLKAGVAKQVEFVEEKFNFKNANTGFERSPTSNFITMRRQYWIATSKMAPYTWVEAEAVRPGSHNFSETLLVPGANGGSVLSLRSFGPLDPRGNFADYQVPVRTDQDVEVWMAAIIPPELRKEIKIKIAGVDLMIEGEPIQRYASGFAWYRFGLTKLSGATARLQVVVNNSGPAELQIDTIFLAPVGMTPNGPLPPEIVDESR